MNKYLAISPYSQECLELGVCFHDSEQESYRFFTWGEVSEVSIENIISLVCEKVKEYEAKKIIFSQSRNSTKSVKENFASLASMVDLRAISKEMINEIYSLLNKGVYSVANLERKGDFWYVKGERLLTQPQLMSYLALIHYLEKETGQKLIQENETPQPLEKEKTYEKQPPIVFTGKIVKCEAIIAKKGANKGSVFYSLLIKHNNSELPQPARVVIFYGLLRNRTIWEKLVSQECLNKNYAFHCWGGGKGLSLSFWKEPNKE